MNENLFKLKKDGKTVGYVQLWHWGGLLYSKDTRFYPNTNKTRLPREIDGEGLTFHSFVTKDKNGKDVFAGDLIKGIISDVSSKSLIGKIVAKESPLSCWMFKWKFEGKEYLAPAPDLQDIELIEDKDDE